MSCLDHATCAYVYWHAPDISAVVAGAGAVAGIRHWTSHCEVRRWTTFWFVAILGCHCYPRALLLAQDAAGPSLRDRELLLSSVRMAANILLLAALGREHVWRRGLRWVAIVWVAIHAPPSSLPILGRDLRTSVSAMLGVLQVVLLLLVLRGRALRATGELWKDAVFLVGNALLCCLMPGQVLRRWAASMDVMEVHVIYPILYLSLVLTGYGLAIFALLSATPVPRDFDGVGETL